MPTIVLIQPPIQDFYHTFKRTIPYGLSCLASILIEHGFSVQILDCLATRHTQLIEIPNEMKYLKTFYGQSDHSMIGLFHDYKHYGYSWTHITQWIKKQKPYIVGISSLFTCYWEMAEKTAQCVKQALPNTPIVLGGHHPTALPESVINSPYVDYVIRGEGELSFLLLVKAIQDGREVDTIPGIVYQKPDQKIHMSQPAIIQSLNDLPLPAMQLIKSTYYQRYKKGSAVIVTSRGCPMTCSYCSVGSSGLPYRHRSIHSVIQEIEQAVVHHHVRFIDFEDENLSLHDTWFMNLLEELIKRFSGLNLELRAMNGLFPPSLHDEMIHAMKQAGFKTLNLSLGSMSLAQLKKFKRPDVRQGFECAIKAAKKYHLNTNGYIIIGAPGQTAMTSLLDLLYLFDHQVLAGVSVFYPSPGSQDYATCEAMGLLPPSFSLMRSSALPIDDQTTRLESVTLLRLARIANFIKLIMDSNEPIPPPEPIPNCLAGILNPSDRMNTGKKLLQWFLHDGIIRGMTKTGEIYAHQGDNTLIHQFIHHLMPLF